MSLRIDTMTRPQLDMALDWAAAEGWNPGLNDGDCYYQADPDGFLLASLNGEAIGCISAVRYGSEFGFIGFYLVKPGFRGQGHGMALWQAAMARLDGCNIGLDGVLAQQDNYRKSGFKLAYSNIRFQGQGGAQAQADDEIVPLSSLPFAMTEAYDRTFFPADRSRFTRSWIAQPGCHALGLVHRGKLLGQGVIRPCRDGYKIGPLQSNSPEIAERLLTALKAKVSAEDAVFLDVAEVNPSAVVLAERHRMTVSFETARMYTGDAPELPLSRLYGVTSFEIG
ncbi:GNAT family N-acetyltransferase [Shewanella cyperi]|uniref:GNAT family N-acetyltransferase n=1 Tax=Shewanella cyperi TaxID=2814292 RepID=A0A974XLF0_9GAMM|nr:GNAT family N-acetyltransferase [Shewanella cyperi]QSX29408.1 GNAT family N-acetyltransferase [Shewanella cyperi]QSX40184.1 GNAT family N-acetyltransferase [Shewanella cyperi]